jgi:ATP-dependent Clp protease protease subunit
MRAVPDDSAPLDADDLVRLFRDCISALALDDGIASGFTVNTVHYYRRKEIIDPPHGRTAAARYHRRHLWQIAGARLAGHLGLVTLAEAREAFRGADEDDLRAFLAMRIAEARGRDMLRAPAPLARETPNARERPRPLPGVRGAVSPASLISLPAERCVFCPPSIMLVTRARRRAISFARSLAPSTLQTHSEEPMSTFHVPYVIERSPRGERTYDIYSRLLMDRIVFLGTEVND